MGTQAGNANTTGTLNVFIGSSAGSNNTGGDQNTFIGHGAGVSNTGGDRNTFVGRNAGENNTGNDNVFIGRYAGRNNTSGSNSIIIGQDVGNSFGPTVGSVLIIGNDAGGAAIRGIIGTGDLSAQGTGWSHHSDVNLKTNIRDIDSASEKLKKIRGVLFKWKDGNPANKSKDDHYGVIAQEIQKVFPELVSQAKARDGKDYLQVNYTGLTPILVEVSKDLIEENEALKSELNELKAQNHETQMLLQQVATDVKGLKAKTGYDIQKSSLNIWNILGILAIAFFGFLCGHKRKSA